MLDWLLGRKRSAGDVAGRRQPAQRSVPTYTRLIETPTRTMPHLLVAREKSPEHSANIDAYLEILSSSPRPPDEVDVLTSLLSGNGVLTLELPDGDGRAALYFTSPVRAADYVEAMDIPSTQCRFLALTFPGMLRMLRDVERMGITKYCLDRCPRCPVMLVLGTSDTRTPEDVWTRMTLIAANQVERLRLYLSYALAAARAGRLEEAREVALETAGHVAMENPEVHLLIGQVGVAMHDETLAREARAFLHFLGARERADRLARSAERGVADFESL